MLQPRRIRVLTAHYYLYTTYIYFFSLLLLVYKCIGVHYNWQYYICIGLWGLANGVYSYICVHIHINTTVQMTMWRYDDYLMVKELYSSTKTPIYSTMHCILCWRIDNPKWHQERKKKEWKYDGTWMIEYVGCGCSTPTSFLKIITFIIKSTKGNLSKISSNIHFLYFHTSE